MNRYRIGREIGELVKRVEALEGGGKPCGCGGGGGAQGSGGGLIELPVRPLGDGEQPADECSQAAPSCVYFVAGFVGKPCPGIRSGDFICVSPCPPCPDIPRLRVVDGQGRTVCILVVRPGAAGGCDPCPPGALRFTWA
ncbi:MAG: hypothetical protein KDH15_17810 [Rhodocyclaceae bacterium]|nr:hypothetical protein [Rhodocyclaceae bacterium]